MRRRRSRLLACCLPALLFAACGGGAGGEASSLPAGWTEGEGDGRDAVEKIAEGFAESAGTEVELAAFYVDEDAVASGGFATNVNVLAEELPDGFDPAQYQEQSIGSLEALGVANPEELPDTEIAGESAQVVEYAQGPTRLQLAVAVHDGTGYNFTLAAAEESFDEAAGDFEEILANWEWAD